MAFGGLLALLDDLTVILDDVAAMSKVAAQKTAGITGDDLAVNAEVLRGIDPKRELPIIWGVAKGSLKNKAFLVPGALILNAFAPWAITPLLMFGGVFLCFEGAEKIIHARKKPADSAQLIAAAKTSAQDLLVLEKEKIAKAIQTDLVLSAEIIALALSIVAAKDFATQVLVLTTIALGMTVVVYGLVGVLVKLDDIGVYLTRKTSSAAQKLGRGLLALVPRMMRVISIVGTTAMFAVGGGILTHGLPMITAFWPQGGFTKMAGDAAFGVAAGFVAVWVWHSAEKPLKTALSKLMKR